MCCLHPLPVVLISCAVYFPFALSLLCLILDTARDDAAQEMVKQLVGKWDNTKWRKCEKKAKSTCDLYILWGIGFCEDSALSIFAWNKFNRKKQGERVLRSIELSVRRNLFTKVPFFLISLHNWILAWGFFPIEHLNWRKNKHLIL